MSVYSGFATRQQQTRYNHYLQLLLSILSKRILKFYHSQPCDEPKFISHLHTITTKMIKLEQFKYMQPHYSYIVRELLVEVEDSRGEERVVTVHYDHEAEEEGSRGKAKFNSMEMMVKQYQDAYERKDGVGSRVAEEGHCHYRSRVKTQNQEKKTKMHYLTPQRPRHSHEHILKPELELQKSENMFKQEKTSLSRAVDRPTVPRIEKPVKVQSRELPMSPRQFLRQTIMGGQSSNPLPSFRAKQKYTKKHKY